MDKISPQFSSRLSSLSEDQTVRAVVLLHGPSIQGPPEDRRNRAIRMERIARMRDSSGEALEELDEILKSFHGKRLGAKPNALGTVTVETTPQGVRALATSDRVKAILEDQKVTLLDRAKQSL